MGTKKPIRALIIEDDGDMALVIKSLLVKRHNADVEIAENRAAARRKLAGFSFDLITLDYRLPDCSGLDLLDEITSSPTHPPVVMVTGYGDDAIANLAFIKGACGYARKDDSLPEVLGKAVDNALRGGFTKRHRAQPQ